jgi:hypothetical protein
LLVVPTTDEIVDAYWTYFHLSQGDKRKRAAADDYFWGWEEVASMVDGGRIEDTLKLLDALLQSPSADPCVVGAGPLENLLSNRRDESQKQVDERVRQEPAWREAMECAHP